MQHPRARRRSDAKVRSTSSLFGRTRRPPRRRHSGCLVLVTLCNSPATPSSAMALVDMTTGDARLVEYRTWADDSGATGLSYSSDRGAVVALPGTRRLLTYTPQLEQVADAQVEGLLDAHSVAVTGATTYVVTTAVDGVLEYRVDGGEYRLQATQYLTDARTDTLHVNSVCVHEGRVLVSAFGHDWRQHGPTASDGMVLDLHSREIVSASLRHPHSLTSVDSSLYVLGSATGTVERVQPDGRRSICARYPGYLRGLAVGSAEAVVGVSGRRRRSRGLGTSNAVDPHADDRCLLLRYDANWDLQGTVDCSWLGREIYDVAFVGATVRPPTAQDSATAAKSRIAELEASWESAVIEAAEVREAAAY